MKEHGLFGMVQVIRFFVYTILYWTLPRDRVIEPEEEEDQPLAPDDDAKSDAKKDAKRVDKKEDKKDDRDCDVEMGTTMFADGSTHGMGQPLAMGEPLPVGQPLAMDRRRSTRLTSLDLGRRQSLGRDMGRLRSLESLGSQELFGWHREGLGQEVGPGRSGSAALEARSSLQTALPHRKSPRTPKKQLD